MPTREAPLGERIDHIAIVVQDLDAALGVYHDVLGLPLERVEEVPAEKVKVAFLPVGDGQLELLEPTGPDSPIAKHIERRGPGLHHVCLRVDDIEAAMADLKAQGFRLLSEEPQPGAHGCRICFVHPKASGGVLLELSEQG